MDQARQVAQGEPPGRRGALLRYPCRFVLFLFFTVVLNTTAMGQAQAPCSITCPTTSIASPLNVFAGSSCAVVFRRSNLGISVNDCPDPVGITVLKDGVALGQGNDSATVDMTSHIGDILEVEIRYGTLLFCTIFVRVTDVTSPAISVRDTILPCTVDPRPQVIGFPTILENCDPNYSLTYADQIRINPCDSFYTAVITRTWTARDAFNNVRTSVQTIRFLRPLLSEVVFPRDTTLSCSALSTLPEVTGAPLWRGLPFPTTAAVCAYNVSYVDAVISEPGTNGICRTIRRTWTVVNSCTLETRVSPVQTIAVVDNEAPTFRCPDPKSQGTSVGVCAGTVTLDAPVLSDNCDPDPYFTVRTSYGAVGTGPHPSVPLGTHSVVYTAWDACGNSRSCTTTVTVTDNERPIAVCDDELVVSVNETGTAMVTARTFNEGSRDNCVVNLYYKVRRMTTGACNNINGDDSPTTSGIQEWFDDNVLFCCSDVGPVTIPVVLRVYTVNPGVGPVNPAREQPGGDLFGRYNECMSMVRLKDPILPQVFCPDNATVECNSDLSNLARFGNPVVIALCGYTLDTLVQRNLNDCGRGTITRTFKATKADGISTSSCTQIITVQNNQNLRAADIQWPKSIKLDVCGASTDPQHLPLGHQQPTILRQPACGLSGVMYEDKLYDAAQPACFKVVRTWSVIDWCVYDPSNPQSAGRFQFSQIIDVEDRTAPTFQCPTDIVVSASVGCQSAQVLMPALTASDCSPTVYIANNSPFSASPGANISGTYPIGTTVVTYRITDGCGNSTSCQVKVIVEDTKPPSVVCIKGLSTALSQMPGGVMAMVDAKTFDAGTTDNCTEKGDIRLTVRRAIGTVITPPSTTQLTLDCSDLGEVPVEIWATDQAGNSSNCQTTLRLTDNFGLCPPDIGTGAVAGAIVTENGNDVENVSISVVADKPLLTSTGVNGAFQLKNVPFGYDYTLTPRRNDDVMNGVSTADLVRLSKHVLGIQPFTSPYQWIAADMDKSGTISTLDMVKLRRLILGKDAELPNGNTSWRFVDAAFQFPKGNDPLQMTFPEVKKFQNFKLRGAEANFVAVKIGDINGSALSNSLMKSESRSSGGDMVVRVKDLKFKAGETFTLDFMSNDLPNVIGYQFTLDFDERLLELVDTKTGTLPDVSLENFGFTLVDKGMLPTIWMRIAPTIPEGDIVLFRLTFKAKQSSNLVTALKVTDQPTLSEAYNQAGELMQILLHVEDEQGKILTEGSYDLFQNFPNPFGDKTIIGFTLPKEMEAELSIFDLAGRRVFQHRGKFDKGYNQVPVNRSILPGTGVFIYQLSTAEYTATRKMTLAGGG